MLPFFITFEQAPKAGQARPPAKRSKADGPEPNKVLKCQRI